MSAARNAMSLTSIDAQVAARDTPPAPVAKWTDGADAQSILLRHSGGRPLRIRGDLMAEGSSWAAGSPCWHELSLYRCENGQIATAQRTRQAASAAGGHYRAVLHADMENACQWLETFDATMDLDAGFDVANMALSAASIAVEAAALRDRASQVAREYRSLVGEILYRLAAES